MYQNGNENLFIKYFFELDELPFFDETHHAEIFGGNLFKSTNDHEVFLNSHLILKFYKYFENPIFLECMNNCIKNDACLGIHIRGTDHYLHGELLDESFYLNELEKKFNSYPFKSIFVATDEARYIDLLTKRFGNLVTYNNNIARSLSKVAVHMSGAPYKEKLITDVLMDALSLSCCEDILITSSNVSAYTLMINPYIKHTFIDKHILYS